MTAGGSDRAGTTSRPVQVPLSALEHYAYCPRQAGLILLEDGYADDAATVRGALMHRRVHEPGDDLRGVCGRCAPSRCGMKVSA
jgi:CRISPR-associated exonuclease Cas4